MPERRIQSAQNFEMSQELRNLHHAVNVELLLNKVLRADLQSEQNHKYI